MPQQLTSDSFVPVGIADPRPARAMRPPLALQYGSSLVLVGLATAAAAVARNVIAAPNITLLYVLPVIIAATFFGWWPALLTVIASVTAYDYFFTVPYYSLTMTDPAEIWAAVLLGITAVIVASLSAQSRRRAALARDAAERAEALQGLAHAVIHARAEPEVLQVAATALHRIFRAPAVIFLERDGALQIVASAGAVESRAADLEGARHALAAQVSIRGETYPNDQTHFDFWPFAAPGGSPCVLGVDFAHAAQERPSSFGADIEAVAGYIASAQARTRAMG